MRGMGGDPFPIFIKPDQRLVILAALAFVDHRFAFWQAACEQAETSYFGMLDHGASPQQARSVLPNSLKTEIVMTANLREWRHVFRLRTSSKAHPQMQQIMRPLLVKFQEVMPELYSDIIPE
jgi:thymidylate synthase (FAD)